MIQIKEGVIFKELSDPFYHLCWVVEEVWKKNTTIQPTITSANDGKHMDGSLHYKNLAWDLRTRNLEEDQVAKILTSLQSSLGIGWDVVQETDHIHVEFDQK